MPSLSTTSCIHLVSTSKFALLTLCPPETSSLRLDSISTVGSHDFLPSVFQQLHALIFFQYLKFPLPVPLNSLHSCGFHPQILAVVYLPLCLFNNFLHSVGFDISISSIYLVSKSKLSPILPLQQLLAFIWIQYLDFPPGPPHFFALMSFQNRKLPSPPVSTSVSLNNFLVLAFICFQYLNLSAPAAEHLHEHTSPISKASASTCQIPHVHASRRPRISPYLRSSKVCKAGARVQNKRNQRTRMQSRKTLLWNRFLNNFVHLKKTSCYHTSAL